MTEPVQATLPFDFSKRIICVAYPSPELIDVRFHTALIEMITQSSAFVRVGITNAVSSRIVANRNLIVDNARQMGATDILWIDADTKFPVNGLVRLLSYDKDIVCATTCRRKMIDHAPIGIPIDRSKIQPGQKLVDMRFIGLPFMLTKMSVFDKLQKPYFAEPPRQLMIEKYGSDVAVPYENFDEWVLPEDEYFCYMARKAGFQIWCDMELTMEIGHIGSDVFYVRQQQQILSAKVDIDLGKSSPPLSNGSPLGITQTDETFHRAQDGIGE